MTSSDASDPAVFSHYVRWALGVKEPMTIQYHKDKKYVAVEIPSDFISNDLCNVCVMDGPHHTPDHIFRILIKKSNDGTLEMRIFNDHNINFLIASNTEAYAKLKPLTGLASGNMFPGVASLTSYFYGNRDKDDPSTLYINMEEWPFQ